MGVIKRQVFKNTIVSYFGILLGIFSTFYIYPLDEGIYGLARFLISMAALLAPLLSFGLISQVIRFFPHFQDKSKGHHGFLGLLLFLAIVFILLLGGLLYVLREPFYGLLESINMDADIFSDNLLEIGVLVFLTIFINIVTSYISNFRRIVIPSIFNSLYLKIGLPGLVLLYYFGVFDNEQFKWGLILLHFLILASLVIYTYRLGELYLKPAFGFLTKKLVTSMAGYSIHGVFTSLGATAAFRIDAIMTASLLGFSSTGIFSIADNIAGIIATPHKSLISISASVVTQDIHNDNFEKVEKMYQSSSISMMIIGLGMLISLYVSIDSVFALSNQYEVLVQGINVVLLLGLAKVVDGTGGINNLIVGYSKLFRWNFILVLVLGIINVMLNLYLIPRFGIEGAALATLLSITIFNVLQCIIIWVAFRIQPFSLNHFWVLAIAMIAYFLGSVIPDTGFNLLNILLKSGVTLSVFGGLVLYFNFSPDINSMVHTIMDRGRKLIRK